VRWCDADIGGTAELKFSAMALFEDERLEVILLERKIVPNLEWRSSAECHCGWILVTVLLNHILLFGS
jgi:hypothetical protein